MKTTPTTPTTPVPKASTADQPGDSQNEKPERKQATGLKPPVTYPNLEEHVPEDCFTTQDQPPYGKHAGHVDGASG